MDPDACGRDEERACSLLLSRRVVQLVLVVASERLPDSASDMPAQADRRHTRSWLSAAPVRSPLPSCQHAAARIDPQPARLLQVRPFAMSASRSRSPSSSLSPPPPVILPPVSQPTSPHPAKAPPRKKAKKEEVDPAALPIRSQSSLRIGAHVSAAGGVDQACVNAASIGYVTPFAAPDTVHYWKKY